MADDNGGKGEDKKIEQKFRIVPLLSPFSGFIFSLIVWSLPEADKGLNGTENPLGNKSQTRDDDAPLPGTQFESPL